MQLFTKPTRAAEPNEQTLRSLFSEIKTLSDIKLQCKQCLEALDYEYFSYCGYFPTLENNQHIVDFPERLITTDAGGEINFAASFSNYAQTNTKHCLWKEIKTESSEQADALSNLLNKTELAGIHNGICFPIHGAGAEWGMFNVATNGPMARTNTDTLQQLQLMAISVHESVKAVSATETQDDSKLKKVLSPREQECLDWTAAGKTAWETAQIIGITESTVSFHMRNSITKLNANNRSHAVAVAMARSLIKTNWLT